jgi:hypothetical protein
MKQVFKILLIMVLTIACEEKDKNAEPGGGKLLENVVDSNGFITKYEYDAQNRIIKIYNRNFTQTIVYSADGSVKINDKSYRKNETTITIQDGSSKRVFTMNEDGYVVKSENDFYKETWQYQGGNLISINGVRKDNGNKTLTLYRYDDKPSPFRNCKTPRWILSILSVSGNKNNKVSEETDNGLGDGFYYGFSYEYDKDGFPTKEIISVDGEKFITTFTYRNETKGAN